MNLPPPNLNGDYRDSCVVCMRGTDTALGFQGVAEFAMAGLMQLGVPDDQAAATVVRYFETELGADPGKVLDGVHQIVVRVCGECAAKSAAPFPNPGLLVFGVPVIAQK